MKRPAKKSNAKPTVNADLAAVLRQDGEHWKALLVRFGPMGSRFEQAGDFGPECGDGSAAEDLMPWLDELMPARVVIVVPGNDVILRSIQLPRATPGQQQQALTLQAEGAMSLDTPRCRVACAVVPTHESGAEPRTGVVLEWKLGAVPQLPPGLHLDERRRMGGGARDANSGQRVTFTAPVTALLGLVAVDGLGTAPTVCVDARPDAGGIAVVAARDEQVVARTLIEASGDASEFSTAISEALNETAVVAHWPEDDVVAARRALSSALKTGFRGLATSRPLGAALAHAPDDAQWRAQYGDLVGVALALRGPLAPLTGLLPAEPRRSQGLLLDTLHRMDSPSAIKKLAVAACLTVVFGPMAIAGIRVGLLSLRIDDPASFEKAMQLSERRLALYGQIDQVGWPMTKLLSDIACTTPDGIELESITIDHGANIQVRGVARGIGEQSSVDAIVLMEQRMRASKVFTRLVKSWEEPKGGSTEFSITAQAADPMLIVRYSESQDFGKKSIAEQRWGAIDADGFLIEVGAGSTAPAAGAASTTAASTPANPIADAASAGAGTATPAPPVVAAATPAPADGAKPTSAGAASTAAGATSASTDAVTLDATDEHGAGAEVEGERSGRGRRGSLAAAGAGEASRRGRPAVGSASAAPAPIPPALTQDQVDGMSRDEARDMLIKVAELRGRLDLDEETAARLKRDFDLLKVRTRNP